MTPDLPAEGTDPPYTIQYAADDEDQPLLAIVDSVAWVNGVDVRELQPLHRAVDVDTLEDLLGRDGREFERSAAADAAAAVTVTFQYEGCRITVDQDHVVVDPE